MPERDMISGGPIKHFTAGWAQFPFSRGPAHYWTEDTKIMPPTIGERGRVRYFESACKRALAATNDAAPPLVVGTWTLCKLCLRIKGGNGNALSAGGKGWLRLNSRLQAPSPSAHVGTASIGPPSGAG